MFAVEFACFYAILQMAPDSRPSDVIVVFGGAKGRIPYGYDLANQGLAFAPGFGFLFVATTTLVTGALFMMWLGEQITEKGVGNGISILIFAGIVLFVADRFLLLGLIMAVLCVTGWIVVPLAKFIYYLASSPELTRQRPRAVAVTGAIVAVLFAFLFRRESWCRYACPLGNIGAIFASVSSRSSVTTVK